MDFILDRVKRCQRVLRSNNIDVLVIPTMESVTEEHLFYYFVDSLCESAFLCIPAKGKATLYVAGFEFARFSKSHGDVLRVEELDKRSLAALKKNMLSKKVGFDGGSSSYRVVQWMKKKVSGRWIDLSKELSTAFLSIDDEEMRRMKKACLIGSRILASAIAAIPQCVTEMDVQRYLAVQCAQHGVTFSFPPIIATGAHAASPHHHTSHAKLRKGFLLFDFGVRFEGYCSDISRTVYLGTPSSEERAAYAMVLRAQQASEAVCKAGVTGAMIDKASRDVIGESLIHAVGHGLGRIVHQLPHVSPRGDVPILAGSVFTIEPGTYVPGKFGIRIEDDYYMTKSGVERLSKGSRKLRIIPF